MSLSIHSPDELIAAIPHMLGFKPQESIVLIPIRSDLPTARIDLPATPRAEELAWSSIRKGMVRYARPGAGVGIVCFTHNRQQADLVGREFVERLDTIGIDTHLLLWADETRWADLVTGDMGLQTDAARERVATMTVLAGRPQPASTRDSLAQSLVGDREPVATLLTETRANTAQSAVPVEGRWAVSRVQQFQRDAWVAAEHAASIMVDNGWPQPTATGCVEYVCSQLIRSGNRATAYARLTRDHHAEALLDLSHDHWIAVLQALLGNQLPTHERAREGRGLLQLLALGYLPGELSGVPCFADVFEATAPSHEGVSHV